ncbi:hypothetical protein V2W30_41240 (plasmid) [Streptomyces sp. Q6]|uniref:Uncharacterized protein n=1 Tax=Streptomyces citrinus TaxID=3118173 RepID=A0ACD5AQU1_9ACTN
MLLHDVASARADFTKESLEGVRARVGELPGYSRLVPAARSRQALLESLLLGALTAPAGGLAAFCIAQVVPQEQRLDVHLTHGEAFLPFFDLLPSRDQDKTIHGVGGLRAQPAGRGIDVWFDGQEGSALLHVSCRGVDMIPLLSDHESTEKALGRRPLWTHSTPPPRAARGGRPRTRRRDAPITPPTLTERHGTSMYLASALLRRPGLWERLAGHQGVRVVSEEADHGLDWHVRRRVGPEVPPHDDRLAAVLENTLAGPGLVMDRTTHECGPSACHMRFIPRLHGDGWDGILTVTTTSVPSDTPVPATRRPRPFSVLGEQQTADGPACLPPLRPNAPGRVLQLEMPPMTSDNFTPRRFAEQLGAAWALHGERVLLVGSARSTVPRRPWRSVPQWPHTERPKAPTSGTLWQPARLVSGAGALYEHVSDLSLEALADLVAWARVHFDWILLADDWIHNHLCPGSLEGIADEYLLLSNDQGFEVNVSVSHPRHRTATGEGIPLTPAEAAMVWRERTLRHVPVDTIPVTGVLLMADEAEEPQLHRAFVAEADRVLARLGTPVLGRFPARLVRGGRTVLDHEPEEADGSLCDVARAVAIEMKATLSAPEGTRTDSPVRPCGCLSSSCGCTPTSALVARA